MKKPLVPPAIHTRDTPLCKSEDRRSTKPRTFVTRPGPTPLGKRRVVSYLPGQKRCKEPSDLPRLFIRGCGGSIKLDLGGVGIGLSDAVFAHFVADDSLLSLHVCPGDLALIEPAVRRFYDGNLVLLETDGRPVIRRLRRVKRLWMLDSVDPGAADSLLLHEHAIQGFVIGFVRLLNQLRPVKYEGTDANYESGFEKPTPSPNRPVRADAHTLQKNARRRGTSKRAIPSLPSADKAKSLFSLSEIDRKSRYKAWPDK